MKKIPEQVTRFLFIGAALFFSKFVLIAFAYFLDKSDYNLFNQIYYTASLLILFGSFGFEIAQVKIPIKLNKLFILVFTNIVITYIVIHFSSFPFNSIYKIISVIFYSILIAIGGILNFKLLYTGKYRKFFYVLAGMALCHFLIVPGVSVFKIDLFVLMPAISLLWFVIFYKLIKDDYNPNNDIKEFYKIGFSAFIINSAVSLGLNADKFVVNHFFAADIANAYTFAWALTAPVFYIGNLIEKFLFTQKPDANTILKRGLIVSLFIILAYSVSIVLAVTFIPRLIPTSVSADVFKSIFIFMISGYSVYVIIHFPINTFLFKMVELKQQKLISKYFSIVIIFYTIVFYFYVGSSDNISYITLLLIVWSYIFLLLIIKSVIIFVSSKKRFLPITDDRNG